MADLPEVLFGLGLELGVVANADLQCMLRFLQRLREALQHELQRPLMPVISGGHQRITACDRVRLYKVTQLGLLLEEPGFSSWSFRLARICSMAVTIFLADAVSTANMPCCAAARKAPPPPAVCIAHPKRCSCSTVLAASRSRPSCQTRERDSYPRCLIGPPSWERRLVRLR